MKFCSVSRISFNVIYIVQFLIFLKTLPLVQCNTDIYIVLLFLYYLFLVNLVFSIFLCSLMSSSFVLFNVCIDSIDPVLSRIILL